jgi:hypothetical protein
MRALEARVAVTGDVPQLMDAVPPLANVSRYGDVRQTDVLQVLHVIDGLVARIAIGLRVAVSLWTTKPPRQMAARINALHSAIKLTDREENLEKWLNALSQIADGGGIHDRLSGSHHASFSMKSMMCRRPRQG